MHKPVFIHRYEFTWKPRWMLAQSLSLTVYSSEIVSLSELQLINLAAFSGQQVPGILLSVYASAPFLAFLMGAGNLNSGTGSH